MLAAGSAYHPVNVKMPPNRISMKPVTSDRQRGGHRMPDYSFSDLLAIVAFVKPYWERLYILRDEFRSLRRKSTDTALHLTERSKANAGLDILEQQAQSLLQDVETADVPALDPTDKVGQLREAISNLLKACSERHGPYT